MISFLAFDADASFCFDRKETLMILFLFEVNKILFGGNIKNKLCQLRVGEVHLKKEHVFLNRQAENRPKTGTRKPLVIQFFDAI